MTSRAAATRYARALFDVVATDGDLRAVESELAGFTELVQKHDGLWRVLANPAVPAPRKRAVVEQLLKRIALKPPVSKLLLVLADHDRLVLLPDLVEAFRLRVLEHHRVVRAEVTTAVPLADDRRAALQQSLAAATGRD